MTIEELLRKFWKEAGITNQHHTQEEITMITLAQYFEEKYDGWQVEASYGNAMARTLQDACTSGDHTDGGEPTYTRADLEWAHMEVSNQE